MCLESAYYDTCIFLASLNANEPESEHCQLLLNSRRISWEIALHADLSAGESSAKEFIDRFEVNCIANGVTIHRITARDAQQTSKAYRELKRKLQQRGFVDRDWRHLMAAVSAHAKLLCSLDADFWDPANKATRRRKKRSETVRRIIESELPIEIRLPSEALEPCD